MDILGHSMMQSCQTVQRLQSQEGLVSSTSVVHTALTSLHPCRYTISGLQPEVLRLDDTMYLHTALSKYVQDSMHGEALNHDCVGNKLTWLVQCSQCSFPAAPLQLQLHAFVCYQRLILAVANACTPPRQPLSIVKLVACQAELSL